MVDLANLEIGQNVPLNVEEELREGQEPVQTLLPQTEALTVKETTLKPENATLKDAQVRYSEMIVNHEPMDYQSQ